MIHDVVIPARNEETTIAPIVRTFLAHPNIGQVIVAIDPDTTDETVGECMGLWPDNYPLGPKGGWFISSKPGKGECVQQALTLVTAERVVFCDADLMGLCADHVTRLTTTNYRHEMIVGVPDYPSPSLLEATFTPSFIDRFLESWVWMTGERSLPTEWVKDVNLYGYLMETQINQIAEENGARLVFARLGGLISPLHLTPQRIREMRRDAERGRTMGILP